MPTTITQETLFDQPGQKIKLPATGVQQTLPGCGAKDTQPSQEPPQSPKQDSEIPLPFSGNQVDEPEPLVDLTQPVYLDDFKQLAEEDNDVYAEKSQGRGKNHGKRYYRLTVSRSSVVRHHDGRLYEGGRTGPEEYTPGAVVRVDEWEWNSGILVLYERVKDLLTEHREVVEEHPFLAACADELYRHLITQGYDVREHYNQSGLTKFWLNCYNLFRYHELQEPFQIRLIGWPVGKAVKTAFPDTTITKWPDIPHGFLKQLVVKVRREQ